MVLQRKYPKLCIISLYIMYVTTFYITIIFHFPNRNNFMEDRTKNQIQKQEQQKKQTNTETKKNKTKIYKKQKQNKNKNKEKNKTKQSKKQTKK